MPPLPPAGLPSSLLERRPDVRAAEQTLLAANARIGVAKAAMFPSISLTGIAGGQSKDFNNLMQLPARIWTLGFGISLPLFDAGRNAARVEQAEARQRQSVAGYQKAVEAAFRETADALSNVALASEAEKAWQERLDSARHSLRLSMLRYEAGYSSYLEVLDAQRTANDTELGFIRNRQSRLAFSVDLMKALGGALEEPVRPVEVAGWDGDALEAQAFGVLGARVARGLPLSFPSTTGAPRPLTGGRIIGALLEICLTALPPHPGALPGKHDPCPGYRLVRWRLPALPARNRIDAPAGSAGRD
jgi:hypothetical protein